MLIELWKDSRKPIKIIEKKSKSYFINLWNGLKSLYVCALYKDLNPMYFDEAIEYIKHWEYKEQ